MNMFWSTLNAFSALNCFAAGLPLIGLGCLTVAVVLLAVDVVETVRGHAE